MGVRPPTVVYSPCWSTRSNRVCASMGMSPISSRKSVPLSACSKRPALRLLAPLGRLKVGTRVLAEGPFGVFTSDTRTRDKVLMIAGGIGITPVRALLEEFRGDVITVYRALTERDLVLATKSTTASGANGGKVEYIVGESDPEGGAAPPEHLMSSCPTSRSARSTHAGRPRCSR